MSDLIWIQTVWNSRGHDAIPERTFFEKVDFEKYQQTTEGKELRLTLSTSSLIGGVSRGVFTGGVNKGVNADIPEIINVQKCYNHTINHFWPYLKVYFCLSWFVNPSQQFFSHVGMGLPGLNQY